MEPGHNPPEGYALVHRDVNRIIKEIDRFGLDTRGRNNLLSEQAELVVKQVTDPAPRETLGQGQAIRDFHARQGHGYPMRVGQLSESDAIDAHRLPFFSSRHAEGPTLQDNQFDLGNTRQGGFTLDCYNDFRWASNSLTIPRWPSTSTSGVISHWWTGHRGRLSTSWETSSWDAASATK